MSNSTDVDTLYEELMLEKVYSSPKMPPVGGFVMPHEWWYFEDRCARVTSKIPKDLTYLNCDGEKHRLSGPAYINRAYDITIWYKNGQYHRNGGPALVHKNTKIWFYEGKLHNLNGPAIITTGGPKEYWIQGQKYSPKEYQKEIKRRKRKGTLCM